MPRLIVPSMGGGAKRSASVRAGDEARAGEGDSCAFVIVTSARSKNGLTMRMRTLSNIIAPIQIRKDVAARFAFQKKAGIDFIPANLFVKTIEAQQVILRSLRGVVRCSASFHQECPVARLREEKLA